MFNADGTHLTDIYYTAKATTQPENIYIYGRQREGQETEYPIDFLYHSIEDSLTENEIQITANTEKAKKLHIDGAYHIAIPGDYNEGNAVAAAITSALMGAKPSEIEYGLSNTTVPGRMEIYQTKDHGTIYVDYAHNYGSLHSVLDFLKSQAPKSKVTVITGSTGDKGIDRREGLGKAINESADQAYLTTDDPATEDPKKIAEEIAQHIDPTQVATSYIADRKQAITKAVTESKKGDLVVVAGKGMTNIKRLTAKCALRSDAAIVKIS